MDSQEPVATPPADECERALESVRERRAGGAAGAHERGARGRAATVASTVLPVRVVAHTAAPNWIRIQIELPTLIILFNALRIKLNNRCFAIK